MSVGSTWVVPHSLCEELLSAQTAGHGVGGTEPAPLPTLIDHRTAGRHRHRTEKHCGRAQWYMLGQLLQVSMSKGPEANCFHQFLFYVRD